MNFQYYKPGHPETEIAAMGAIDSGLVKLVYLPNDPVNSIHSDYLDISHVKEWLEENDLVTTGSMIDFDRHTHYYNLKDGVAITDNTSACFAQVKKFMIFDDPDKVWVKVSYRICGSNAGKQVFVYNNTINVTEDHPLAVKTNTNKTRRVFASDLKVGDKLVASARLLADINKTEDYCSKLEITVESVRKTKNYVGYDFETSTDKFDIGDIVSHNCRTRVIGNSYDTEHQQVTGRGNLFFTTLNLPYLALLAKEELGEFASSKEIYDKFTEHVDKLTEDAVDISRERFAYISKRKAKNFPFLMGQHLYLGSENLLPDDTIEEVIKQGSISIGFIGLAETLTCIFGKHHGESEESQKYGLKIVGHLHDLMERYSKSENMNYSLFATPAEGCSGRLLRACKKRFGIVKGVTDKEYLTNSMHVPVGYEISAADKVDIEAPYHPLCTAGIISYVELDYDATKNIDAFEALVDYMADSGMTYFSINHPVDHDPVCGYVGYFPNGICPRCGRKEGEGVPVSKLLSLASYNPTPAYAVNVSELERDDLKTNTFDINIPDEEDHD